MKKISKILSVLCLGFALLSAPAIAQEEEGCGFEAGVGLSAGDVLSEVGFVLKPFFSWDVKNSGFVIGVEEWTVPILPEAGLGELETYQEYGFALGQTIMSLSIGNDNYFVLGEDTAVDGCVYGVLGFTLNEVDVAAVELDFGYLSASSFGFGLSAVVGLGYEFAIGNAGTLGLWVDFNLDLYEEAGLGDIEESVSYEKEMGNLFIGLSVDPTISPSSDWSVSVDPTL